MTSPPPAAAASPNGIEQELQAVKDQQTCDPAGPAELKVSDLELGDKLGTGFFGSVYEGKWRGHPVALKFCSPDLADSLRKETVTLYGLQHPRIMQLYGICEGEAPPDWPEDARAPAMCCELLSKDHFVAWLKKQGSAAQHARGHWSKVCGLLEQAASGLEFLHENHAFHRDIKGMNLVLDEAENVKLIDFGLARFRRPSARAPAASAAESSETSAGTRLQQLKRSYTSSVGTYTHMAPEVISGEYDISADIFSFGILLCEALAAEDAEEIVDSTRTKNFGLSVDGLRAFVTPDHPAECERMVNLAAECCDLDPSKRPTAQALRARLGEIKAAIDTGSAH